MKVYTEIVYTWDEEKGQLVEESSKSFEYEGPVAKCDEQKMTVFGRKVNKPHSHSSTVNDLSDTFENLAEGNVQDTIESGTSTLLTNVQNPLDSGEAITDAGKDFLENQTNINAPIAAGPGGSFADVANRMYGGDTKNAFQSAQNFYRDFESGARNFAHSISLKPYLRSEDNLTDPQAEAELSGEGEGDITPEERESLLVQGLAGGRGSTTPGGSTGYRGRSFHQKKGSATILAPSTGLVRG